MERYSGNGHEMTFFYGKEVCWWYYVRGGRTIAAVRVQTRVLSCGICGGQSGAGAGFLRVLRFPLPIFIPPISPQ
jgi:hypothetical protein